MVDIDLGTVKGPKGDDAVLAISGTIDEHSTDSEAASAKAVYDLVIGAIEGEY